MILDDSSDLGEVRSDPRESSRRYPALDGLRGIAIALVLIHHAFPTARGSLCARAIARVVDVGWIGVTLFFVLSGFLIVGTLIDAKGNAHYYRNFLIRRALRILPLYYVFLLVHQAFAMTIARPGKHGFLTPRPLSWPIPLFLTNMPELFPVGPLIGELGPLWSLAVEEQAYLILPVLVARLSRDRLLRLFLATIPLALAWRIAVLSGLSRPEAAYTWTPSALDAFAAGGIVAIAIRRSADRDRCRRIAAAVALASGLALAAICLVLGHFHLWDGMRPILSVGLSALALFFASIVASSLFSPNDSPLNRALSNRALGELGKRSYAIYLFHTAAFDVLHPWLLRRLGPKLVVWSVPTSFLVFALVVAAAYLAAKASELLLERPFLRLKRFFPSGATPVESRTQAKKSQPWRHSRRTNALAGSWFVTLSASASQSRVARGKRVERHPSKTASVSGPE